jgi:hypothetical protein
MQIPLGDVIAERRFTLHEAAGESRLISVRLGRPIATDQKGAPQEDGEKYLFRCPLQITGLDCDDKVFAPFGEDPFVALQYAIHLAGDVLDRACERLNLINRLAVIRERTQPDGPHFEDVRRASWIWSFDSRPDVAPASQDQLYSDQ